MSFGGGASPPKPQPQTPVPQEDDPRGIEETRRAAIAAGKREGSSAHLLTGELGVSADPETKKKALIGGTY